MGSFVCFRSRVSIVDLGLEVVFFGKTKLRFELRKVRSLFFELYKVF